MMNRGSDDYRRGYYHGAAGLRRTAPVGPDWTFAAEDYERGYNAGVNDQLWMAITLREAELVPGGRERKMPNLRTMGAAA